MPLTGSGSHHVLFSKFGASGTKRVSFSGEGRCQNRTDSPVPVRLVTSVIAFLLKGDFEVLDVCAMPGQEVTGEVDLGLW